MLTSSSELVAWCCSSGTPPSTRSNSVATAILGLVPIEGLRQRFLHFPFGLVAAAEFGARLGNLSVYEERSTTVLLMFRRRCRALGRRSGCRGRGVGSVGRGLGRVWAGSLVGERAPRRGP